MLPAPRAFAPFSDRLSRDLRNTLSETLLAALAKQNPEPFEAVAQDFRHRPDLSPALAEYLGERLACYRAIIAQLRENPDPDQAALLLWDHELFFEFHELLEKRWLVATGVAKEVLQGLIRAAGTYVLRQQGQTAGAAKMAARARETLTKHQALLPPGFSADQLLVGLADPLARPPHLGTPIPTEQPCRHASPRK